MEEQSFEEKMFEGKIPSMVKNIHGVGTVEVYGTWDAKKLITKLLECDEITG